MAEIYAPFGAKYANLAKDYEAPTEKERADISKRRGNLAKSITNPSAKRSFIAAQGEDEAKERVPITSVGNSASFPAVAAGMPMVRQQTRMAESEGAEAAQKAAEKLGILAPSKKHGGKVAATGLYKLHKGEKVVPAQKSASKEVEPEPKGVLGFKSMPTHGFELNTAKDPKEVAGKCVDSDSACALINGVQPLSSSKPDDASIKVLKNYDPCTEHCK
jgi:hypothetical protein